MKKTLLLLMFGVMTCHAMQESDKVEQPQNEFATRKILMALINAIKNDDAQKVSQILASGTLVGRDLDDADSSGCNPLLHAIMLNRIHIMILLLQAGADANAFVDKGTALLVACDNHNDEALKILLDYNARPEGIIIKREILNRSKHPSFSSQNRERLLKATIFSK